MIKVLLAEDHEILRDGLKAILSGNSEISIVGEAGNGQEVIEHLKNVEPDVILMDINMPVMNGVEATQYISKNYPDIKVVILSMMEHENYLNQLKEAGAKGYLIKSTSKEELIYAIKMVQKGHMYVCSGMTMNLLSKPKQEETAFTYPPSANLSKREVEVLKLIAEGLTNNEIAERIFTSRRTVETHRMNLISKTGTKNTATLIKYAIKNGLLPN